LRRREEDYSVSGQPGDDLFRKLSREEGIGTGGSNSGSDEQSQLEA